MDFYDLFSSFAQLDILVSMLTPFFDDIQMSFEYDNVGKFAYEEIGNFNNMYKYNTYYINNIDIENALKVPDAKNTTSSLFYNLQSEQITQNLYEAPKFVQYLKTCADKVSETLFSGVKYDGEPKSNFYKNFATHSDSLKRESYSTVDADKIISLIESRLTHDLEASPCGVYS